MFTALLAAGALSLVDGAARRQHFHGVVRVERDGKVTLQDLVGDLTIDELLTHTSGLPRSTYLAEQSNDPDEAAKKILAQPRGSKGVFAYTNDGYSLLAIAAQRTGGAPFFELV